jgi:hypothetical protein
MPPGMLLCSRLDIKRPSATKSRIGSTQLTRKLISGEACVGMLAVNSTPA